MFTYIQKIVNECYQHKKAPNNGYLQKHRTGAQKQAH